MPLSRARGESRIPMRLLRSPGALQPELDQRVQEQPGEYQDDPSLDARRIPRMNYRVVTVPCFHVIGPASREPLVLEDASALW
jgi:hypothetical protein